MESLFGERECRNRDPDTFVPRVNFVVLIIVFKSRTCTGRGTESVVLGTEEYDSQGLLKPRGPRGKGFLLPFSTPPVLSDGGHCTFFRLEVWSIPGPPRGTKFYHPDFLRVRGPFQDIPRSLPVFKRETLVRLDSDLVSRREGPSRSVVDYSLTDSSWCIRGLSSCEIVRPYTG